MDTRYDQLPTLSPEQPPVTPAPAAPAPQAPSSGSEPPPTVLSTPPAPTPPPFKGPALRINKKLLFLITVIIILIFIAIGLVLTVHPSVKNTSNSVSGAQNEVLVSKEDPLIAKVGSREIHKSDVWEAAREQYEQDAITNAVLKRFLDIVIERDILDHEASVLRITLPTDKKFSKTEYYTKLKDAVMEKEFKNVQVQMISFSIGSPTALPQLPEWANEREEGKQALPEIVAKLQNGENAYDVASYIYNKYTALQPILGLNGSIFTYSKNDPSIKNPSMIILEPPQPNTHYFNPDLYAALTTMKEGDVRRIDINSDDEGGMVVKAVAFSKNGYLNYADFLAAKRKELVVVIKPL